MPVQHISAAAMTAVHTTASAVPRAGTAASTMVPLWQKPNTSTHIGTVSTTAPLLSTAPLPVETLSRCRGDMLDLPDIVSSRAATTGDDEVASNCCLLTTRSVPLRPLLCPGTGPNIVNVRVPDLQTGILEVESVLATTFGVQALSTQEGTMSFYGGVSESQATIFTLEIFEELIQFDEAGQAWKQFIFILDAIDATAQPAVNKLVAAVQTELNQRL